MDAQRQRAVGWSDWLGLVGSAEYIAFFVIEECVHGEQLLLKLKVRVPRLKPPGSKSAVNDIAKLHIIAEQAGRYLFDEAMHLTDAVLWAPFSTQLLNELTCRDVGVCQPIVNFVSHVTLVGHLA